MTDTLSLMDKLNAMQAALDKSLVESIGGAIFELSAIILQQDKRIAELEAAQRRWWRRR